jgi:hypothetical protein
MHSGDALARLLRTIGDRRAVHAMTELDDRTLDKCCGARVPSRTLACC